MSLRATTFQPPNSPSIGNTSKRALTLSPTAPDSPSLAVDERHRAQLASYRRDNNGETRQSSLPGPASIKLSKFTSLAKSINGIIGAGVSGGDHDEGTGGHKLTRPSTPPPGGSHDRRASKASPPSSSKFKLPGLKLPRRRRALLVIAGFALLYFIIAKPLLKLSASRDLPTTSTKILSSFGVGKVNSQEGAGDRGGSTPHKRPPRPLHSRKAAEGSRAPLPAAIIARSMEDHEIHNGLLHVDPKSKMHPIYQLIRDARETWDDKVERQSSTLQEAVDEYKRRYGRAPPKGFDKWWDWVCENNVQMPDEYDQIDSDLRPFRALHPNDLKNRVEAVSHYPDTYTIRVQQGVITTSATYDEKKIGGADDRLEGQLKLLRPVAKYLSDFTAVFTVHDTPSVLISHGHRHELNDHVIDGEYIDPDEELDLTRRGWAAACPQSSPIHSYDRFGTDSTTTTSSTTGSISSKTFIASHDHLMNICAHPELIPIHGFLSGKNPAVGPLAPIFCLSKTSLHADILGVPTEQWMPNLPNKPWDERTEDRLLWRGSNTGGYFSEGTTWRNSHRLRLNRQATMKNGNITVIAPPKLFKKGETIEQASMELNLADTNKVYMDIAFTGKPIQCNVEDGTCEALENEHVFGPQMTHEAAFNYKYVVDVDGNAWSARFQRLLGSGSLVFKSTIMPEWWQDRIQPWVHYVPLQVDYSDLYDLVSFFRGNTTNQGGEPNLAREIAQAGRNWSITHWRQVDMTAYMFRLYLEWARLNANNRSSMDFVYDPAMERSRKGKRTVMAEAVPVATDVPVRVDLE